MPKWTSKWYKVQLAPFYVKVNDISSDLWNYKDVLDQSLDRDYREEIRHVVLQALQDFLLDQVQLRAQVKQVSPKPVKIHPEEDVVELNLADYEIIQRRLREDSYGRREAD